MTADEVKEIRKRLGLTQVELAERLGVGQNTVSRWESGGRRPSGPAVILLRQMAEQKRVLANS